MKKLLVLLSAAFALALFARPAQAEEKNPGKLMQMLESRIAGFKEMGEKYKENPKFKEFIKYSCQKGNMFGGVFGACRSGEGIVCKSKKEAFVACSVICGVLGEGMKESEGFAESKCVKDGGPKWGFADHHAAVEFAKTEIKTRAQNAGPVTKLCAALKPILAKLPAGKIKEFAEVCP